METNKVEIDKNKAEILLNRVIAEEAKNVKTKKYGFPEMVKNIKNMIEEEIQCY